MNNKELNQKAGDGAIQNQTVSGDIINNYHYSISREEIENVAMQVFHDNFIKLRGDAEEIVTKRAKELLDKFLTLLGNEFPSSFERLSDPAMQSSLHEAQKQYAINGDEESCNLMVRILLEMVQNSSKSIQSIILDTALESIPKLTQSMIDTLTLLFLQKNIKFNGVDTLQKFVDIYSTFVLPFALNLCKTRTELQHLLKIGLLETLTLSTRDYASELIDNYPNVFQADFSLEEFEKKVCPLDNKLEFAVRSLANHKFQVNYGSTSFELMAIALGIPESTRKNFTRFANEQKIDSSEVNRIILNRIPELGTLVEMYSPLGLTGFRVSGAGIYLAVENYNQKSGQNLKWTDYLT